MLIALAYYVYSHHTHTPLTTSRTRELSPAGFVLALLLVQGFWELEPY